MRVYIVSYLTDDGEKISAHWLSFHFSELEALREIKKSEADGVKCEIIEMDAEDILAIDAELKRQKEMR